MARRVIHERTPGLGTLERSISVAYGVVGGVLLFAALGLAFDQRFGTTPWMTLLGVLAGSSMVLYGVGRLMWSRTSARVSRRR